MTTPKRFNTGAEPIRTRTILKPLMWLLSKPETTRHKQIINKDPRLEGIKPPYLLLCNHNAFYDFKVATMAIFPQRANYVVAIDGFVGIPGRKWLMLQVGCICKRKFVSDTRLVRQLMKVVENGDIALFYPEARYSLCGTTAVLPESLGKLCKILKVPVVTLICHGHHINSPFWRFHDRNVKYTEADMNLVYTAEDVQTMSVDDINAGLVEAFQYDEYKWQKDNNIRVEYPKRAEGLHKILYQCPHCGTEYEMSSEGTKLKCVHCGRTWTMSELGELSADSGETEFTHIPDWYEWERLNVRKEVESKSYDSGELPVKIYSLPNAKHFSLGKGTLVHDMTGFTLKGTDFLNKPFEEHFPVLSKYSCHIEFDYHKKYGDCLDLSTLEDTWFIAPQCRNFSLTKFALATEELYQAYRKEIGKECKPGLA